MSGVTGIKRQGSAALVGYYTGWVVLAITLLMAVPLLTSLLLREWSAALDFVIGMSVSVLVSCLLIACGRAARRRGAQLDWKSGFAVAALSWLVLMVLCAIPYRLSGHCQSFLDGCFDVMSGFTTTGLVLTQDLDHLSEGLNMWRHMLTFIGGQGMVVLALGFLGRHTSGAYQMYCGEGKDVKLLPNVKNTARIIWRISMVYLLAGTAALFVCGLFIGLPPLQAFLHGLYIFESSWSTGGFAPNTQNMMFYHSFAYELITMVIFILGSLNFGLHYAVWQGKRVEMAKNIEVQSFVITSFLACALAAAKLSQLGVYTNAVSVFRRVVYNVLSAHTTTGFGNVYARQFANEWGDFGILVMTIAMLIGGSACSTAGGFKGLRVGIVFRGLVADVRRVLSPERCVHIEKYHHIQDCVLDDAAVRSSGHIILCYTALFAVTTLLGVWYGYPLAQSAFEAASATGNVGLSIGVTQVSTPALLKVQYILAMYLGRLEFLSVFALIGYVIGGVKKTCARH